MSPLALILSEFVNKSAHIETKNWNKSITIEEPEGTLHSVTIDGFSEIYFALKLDDDKCQFLNGLIPKGVWRKAVDAVIFCQIDSLDYIFLIELKSKARPSESVDKFKSSKAFIAFLSSVFQSHHDISIENTPIISILFDRKPGKSKSPIIQWKGETFRHEGFRKSDNRTRIEKFIRY